LPHKVNAKVIKVIESKYPALFSEFLVELANQNDTQCIHIIQEIRAKNSPSPDLEVEIDCLTWLATLHDETGAVESAMTYYRDALQAMSVDRPGRRLTTISYAKLLSKAGKHHLAIEVLEDVIAQLESATLLERIHTLHIYSASLQACQRSFPDRYLPILDAAVADLDEQGLSFPDSEGAFATAETVFQLYNAANARCSSLLLQINRMHEDSEKISRFQAYLAVETCGHYAKDIRERMDHMISFPT
jgi:hypothetical protein